ncbi:MAG: phosphatidylinositol mannoside acyltransferase [Actinobacteria bacterium]|nr:phosphatidylinositol mannoside acyltransferase [Actinomycetota bacterium]
MKRVAEFGTYLLYSILWQVVRWLPEKSAYRFFDQLAESAYRRNGKRVKRLRENYRRVRPSFGDAELEMMVQAGLKNAMRYWCDTFRISDWDHKRAIRSVTYSNQELLHRGMKAGKGVIVAVPHAGNWDHAGYYYCALGYPVHTVAEHLKPERLFRRFLQHRERMGMTVLSLNQKTIPALSNFLREGKLVALVADRDLSRSGIEVEFFGGRAKMPVGPALLAYQTDAQLITAYVGYRDGGIHISWRGPIEIDRGRDQESEVARVTQEIASIFESEINDDPTSWHMQQTIFIDGEGFQQR